MKLVITTIGGGIFSLYHQAIECLLEYVINNPNNNVTEYQIIIADIHKINKKNLFDDYFIYDQNNTDTLINLEVKQCNRMFLKIYNSPYYTQIKNIVKINTIRPEIIEKVAKYKNDFNINENTLTVHIRLTDMNTVHSSDYGSFNFDSYKNKIDIVLKEHSNIDKLFICSDNNESIYKINEIYSNKYSIKYIEDSYREETEIGIADPGYQSYFNKTNNITDFHIKLFIEMLTASKAKYFIYRISDVSNFILAYSDTITDIYSIN